MERLSMFFFYFFFECENTENGVGIYDRLDFLLKKLMFSSVSEERHEDAAGYVLV